MLRDLTGKRIKQTLNSFQIRYMEKFYIYNNKIFQIIRIKEVNKMGGVF
jgi:hypothetical protein